MNSLQDYLLGFTDTLAGHLSLVCYLLAVTDEHAVRARLKKLPPLILSPAAAVLLSAGLHALPEQKVFYYYILSAAVLLMCTVWVRWAWQYGAWRAFAATCMAGIFQVADASLTSALYWLVWPETGLRFAASLALHLGVSAAGALLLYKLRFGMWFRLLLGSEPAVRRTALLLFALEGVMEVFFRLSNGVMPQYLPGYFLLAAVMVILMTVLVVCLAQRLDTARKMQAQRDIIAQQQLYEQDLEIIRREVRAFRHDCKNLLAGLSRQAAEGELEGVCRSLSELDAGFDRRIGKKIQTSAQIGNLLIPEVRSLLLSKLTAMRKNDVECRLEVLYPVAAVEMDVWDFVRCLGILLDNAMEAAQDAEPSWVEIVLFLQDGRVLFRVSNPYANRIDPGKIWEDGWSTKGTGRGVGLPSCQRILEGCPNASLSTSWDSGVFVQELTVEGRT